MLRYQPISTLFPYTTLFRSAPAAMVVAKDPVPDPVTSLVRVIVWSPVLVPETVAAEGTVKVPDRSMVRSASLTFTFKILRSEEHTSELQSPMYLVCRLLLEK